MTDREHEDLVQKLNNTDYLKAYKADCDKYPTGILAMLLGKLIVFSGNTIYGKKPSLGKFKAVEVIARIPYQSWEVASYTLLTGLFENEKKALALAKISKFSRIAQDNETMHVVVISQLAKRGGKNSFFFRVFIPVLFSFFYFWGSFFLYVFSQKASMELNYIFENHAFDQYDTFLKNNEEVLKSKKMDSDFLKYYGRNVETEYDFFRSVRNDELIHRNTSIKRLRNLNKIA